MAVKRSIDKAPTIGSVETYSSFRADWLKSSEIVMPLERRGRQIEDT
jgi:hypothetical protein